MYIYMLCVQCSYYTCIYHIIYIHTYIYIYTKYIYIYIHIYTHIQYTYMLKKEKGTEPSFKEQFKSKNLKLSLNFLPVLSPSA